MSRKPYIYDGKLEYLEMTRMKDWQNDDYNPHDLQEYSELMKPYGYREGQPDNYQFYEWTWPDPYWPDIPGIVIPDPVENPCEVDASCTYAKVMGADKIDCGECTSYSHIHVWLHCPGELPYWAAFGDWYLESSAGGKCHLDAGLVTATLCCDDDASGTATVCWQGAGGDCKHCLPVQVDCELCCEEWTHTGSQTMTTSSSINHTLTPACPDAEVSCTGECTDVTVSIDEAGQTISITAGSSACGGFNVVVTYTREGCDSLNSSRGVRITDTGGWDVDTQVDCTSDCTVDPPPPSGWCGNYGVHHCLSGEVCWASETYGSWPCTGGSCTMPCYQRTCNPGPCCYKSSKNVHWTCDGTFTDCGLL
jgi:hypothetical protein